MEIISLGQFSSSKLPASYNAEQANPFSQQRVTISREEQINLIHQANYWQAQHAQLKQKNGVLEDEIQYLKAKIKDLQNCLFDKKSEKQGLANSTPRPIYWLEP